MGWVRWSSGDVEYRCVQQWLSIVLYSGAVAEFCWVQ